MSKKNLLSESTIRKFMKLASIEPLASDFLGRIQESEEELKEAKEEDMDEAKEELEEAKEEDMDEAKEEEIEESSCGSHNRDDKVEEELDIDEMGGDMMYKDDEDMEMDMDMDMDAEEGGDNMIDLDVFLNALEVALEKGSGQEAEVTFDAEEEDMDMDMDMDAEEEPEMDMGDEEEMMEQEEDLAESIYKKVLEKLTQEK